MKWQMIIQQLKISSQLCLAIIAKIISCIPHTFKKSLLSFFRWLFQRRWLEHSPKGRCLRLAAFNLKLFTCLVELKRYKPLNYVIVAWKCNINRMDFKKTFTLKTIVARFYAFAITARPFPKAQFIYILVHYLCWNWFRSMRVDCWYQHHTFLLP